MKRLFEHQPDGSFLGVLTPRAIQWADGDKDKQAYIGFAGFARDQGLDPFWAADEPSVCGFHVGVVRIHRDLSLVFDEFSVADVPEEEGWDAIVRLLDGPLPVVHILGLSGTLKQRCTSGSQTARGEIIQVDEWMSQWPHHRKRQGE